MTTTMTRTSAAQASNGDRAIAPEVIEQVIIKGNLKDLSPEQRVSYYKAVCDAAGLDSRLNPFEYMTLNGKEILYAKKSCTEQLRNNRKINLQIVSREKVGDCYVVTARAMMPDGREDESIGAVSIGKATGDNLANALMKAETKAKRRVTLSICGLGLLDETELETIPAYREQNDRRSLADKLKGTQAEGLVNAVQDKMDARPACDDEAWMRKFDAAAEARGFSKESSAALYNRVTTGNGFSAAHKANPDAAWTKLIADVEAGKYDTSK
jgi:hypothetical protein